jgi:tetratricopeptide (TPR) repeat protein
LLKGYTISLEPTRIEILQQLLDQNPSSTFARYGLAMEYAKAGDLQGAVAAFEEVTKTDPNYSAAYFHGGQTLEKLGKLDEARDFYRRGIAVTRDPHARSELEAALDILGE